MLVSILKHYIISNFCR